MRKIQYPTVLAGLCCAFLMVVHMGTAGAECITIPQGILETSDGEVIGLGYDQWGYNYQARIFRGYYCGAYRDAEWCQPWKDVRLIMQWNDAWLSNKDCDGDGKLDRYFGYNSYIGSGAWLTNHQWGYYEDNGKKCKWDYFVKIVAAPSDAYSEGGMWYTAEGKELGPVIWGSFAIVQQVENDACAGLHGLSYKAARPSLGGWEW